jgi:hypothetical protein
MDIGSCSLFTMLEQGRIIAFVDENVPAATG